MADGGSEGDHVPVGVVDAVADLAAGQIGFDLLRDHLYAVVFALRRGRTEVRSVWAEPLDTVNWQGFGNVLEEDINFDGYPDLMVCNGPVNTFGNFTYTAFLWDQSSHSFLKDDVKGFDEIYDPIIRPDEKHIMGVWRLDNDVDISTYEWRDGELVQINFEHLNYNELVE